MNLLGGRLSIEGFTLLPQRFFFCFFSTKMYRNYQTSQFEDSKDRMDLADSREWRRRPRTTIIFLRVTTTETQGDSKEIVAIHGAFSTERCRSPRPLAIQSARGNFPNLFRIPNVFPMFRDNSRQCLTENSKGFWHGRRHLDEYAPHARRFLSSKSL